MRRAITSLLAGFVLAAPTWLSAQAAQGTTPSWQTAKRNTGDAIKAAYDAHHREFDYLLGDWEFTATNKEWGKQRGFWSAVRIAEGPQILDEYRIVGDSGETYYVSATIRSYNAVLDRWELISAAAGEGLHDIGFARRVGDEMHIEQTFDAISDKPSLWRIRYYDIRSDRFSWRADRSLDGGKTWVKDYLQIEARRIGPPRTMAALTRSK